MESKIVKLTEAGTRMAVGSQGGGGGKNGKMSVEGYEASVVHKELSSRDLLQQCECSSPYPTVCLKSAERVDLKYFHDKKEKQTNKKGSYVR